VTIPVLPGNAAATPLNGAPTTLNLQSPDSLSQARVTSWASEELQRLTQRGEAVSKVVYLHELEKLTRRIAMLQAVLDQSEDKAA